MLEPDLPQPIEDAAAAEANEDNNTATRVVSCLGLT